MTRALWLIGLAACGRVGFDSLPIDDANVMDSSTIDARLVPCGPIATPPDTVHVTGSTFRYTSFDNDRTILAAVSVSASRTFDGPAIATTIRASD